MPHRPFSLWGILLDETVLVFTENGKDENHFCVTDFSENESICVFDEKDVVSLLIKVE